MTKLFAELPIPEGSNDYWNLDVWRTKWEPHLNETIEILREIIEGKGRYRIDPLEHCANTVEDMKALAVKALKIREGEET